ncbi:MAG: hypothetical protein ACJAXK_002698 [Yoonia sp.]
MQNTENTLFQSQSGLSPHSRVDIVIGKQVNGGSADKPAAPPEHKLSFMAPNINFCSII